MRQLLLAIFLFVISFNAVAQCPGSFSSNDPLCAAGALSWGSATATGSGGTPGYTYLWSNGATTTTVNNLVPGMYGVTITDALSCVATFYTTITAPPALTVSVSSNNPLCATGALSWGSATANGSGGTGGYTYLWDNGTTTSTASNLVENIYTGTLTDGNGCNTIFGTTIYAPPALSGNNNTTICAEDSVVINGVTYNAANPTGIEVFTVGPNNCDSTVTVALNVLALIGKDTTTALCIGGDITIGTNTYNSTGNYIDTLTAVNGCDSVVTTNLTVNNTNSNTIKGVVTFQGAPITSGEVRLIRKDGSSPQTMINIDSVAVNPDGTYEFTNLNLIPGNYMVKALGDTVLYDNVATYADSTNHWQQAAIFSITQNCNDTLLNVDVTLIDFPTPIGFGTINCSLRENGGVTLKVPGDPIPDIDITIEQSPGGAIISGGVTDVNGDFTFDKITAGDYYIYVDIPGYVMDTTFTFTFDGTGPSYDVDVCVYDTVNTIEVCNSVLTLISEVNQNSALQVYPNPTSEGITIEFKEDGIYEISIIDISGKVVLKESTNSRRKNINLRDLNQGIYQIKISHENSVYNHKILLQR